MWVPILSDAKICAFLSHLKIGTVLPTLDLPLPPQLMCYNCFLSKKLQTESPITEIFIVFFSAYQCIHEIYFVCSSAALMILKQKKRKVDFRYAIKERDVEREGVSSRKIEKEKK